MTSKRRIVLVALALMTSLAIPLPTAQAATVVNWSEAFPTTGTVTIPVGTTAVLDTHLDLTGMIVNGTVRCGNRNVQIDARYILVNGTFRCGSHDNRFTKNLTITLTGSGNGDHHGFGDKYFTVAGGKLNLHGQDRVAWTRLTATAPKGAATLRLENHDWKVGDLIVIASTDFRPEQAEEFRITAVNGNRVTVDHPLDYMHYCGTETYKNRSITECAEVGLLSRNITIRGNNASRVTMIGGHAMFLSGSRIRVEGTEFKQMGQMGRLARYPVHFHLFGDAANSYFINNSIWRGYNRFMSIHAAQNLRVTDNVGYDTIGHGFYFEDAVETGNRLVRNLGVLVKEGIEGKLVTPSDKDAATFWITNPDNYVVGNVAAGADHSGFWYALPEHPLGPSFDPNVWPRQTPLGTFHNNTAHSVGFAGLYIDNGERQDRQTETTWYNPRQTPGDDNSPHVRPDFTKFTSYKSRAYGMWVRTFSGARFKNAAYADNWRSVYLANIRSGPDRDNVGLIRDSLMVGETDNVGQPESWETTGTNGRSLPKFWDADAELGGVPFYDGPLEVRKVVFANFVPNAQRKAGAITSLFPDAFWISPENAVYNAKFANARKVLLPIVEEYVDGDATTMFVDATGSVTGTAGSQLVVKGSLMHDDSCTNRNKWQAKQCNVGHISISMRRLDGAWARMELTRDDGRHQGFDGSDDQDSGVFFTVIPEMVHTVDWETTVPKDFNLYIAGISPGAEGDGARVAFPAPSGSWEFQVNGQYDPVAKLSDLNSGGSGWYYHAGTNMIHVRLVGGNWVTLRS
ncbi:MAG: hypothetical protein GY720_10025 [bacterium]|nr:hypothetical protein [bacterium]